ncbi:hypothetical protein LFML04_0297 [Leptospirillum ferriphilum ML-04]|uniref:Uncharacterized protein n=1 Tax=Leptospirillum ferriphilum (strain ML-04) TaxID=1048260 RepID=J9Z9Y2_LEPFM|nr:hypothetical protein LFML04_0297 [Leptospirillum ferriphilum ML-04]
MEFSAWEESCAFLGRILPVRFFPECEPVMGRSADFEPLGCRIAHAVSFHER